MTISLTRLDRRGDASLESLWPWPRRLLGNEARPSGDIDGKQIRAARIESNCLDPNREVVVKTGYGAILHKRFEFPMPGMRAGEIDSFEKLEHADFDDPRDPRRFFEAGNNQIAGVGDGFERNSPPWIETVKSLRPDFPVYGSMGEVSECLTRLIGQENAMLWMGEHPERMGAVVNRIGAHYLECAKGAIDAAAGLLDGFVIWGDVAYKRGMLLSPADNGEWLGDEDNRFKVKQQGDLDSHKVHDPTLLFLPFNP